MGSFQWEFGRFLLETRRWMTVAFSCIAAMSMPCLRAPGGGGWYLRFNSRRLTDATCLPAGITPGTELAVYLLLVSLRPRRLIGSKQIFHIFFLPFVLTSCSTTSLLLLFGWSPLYMQIYTYITRTNLIFFYTDKEIYSYNMPNCKVGWNSLEYMLDSVYKVSLDATSLKIERFFKGVWWFSPQTPKKVACIRYCLLYL